MKQQEIEAKSELIRRTLRSSIGAFCLWQIPLLLKELRGFEPLGTLISSASWSSAFNAAALVGAVLWACLLVRVALLQRALSKDPAARMVLNDERIQYVRLRAFRAGFFALIAYLGVLRVTTIVASVPLGFAVQLGIFVAVLFTTAAFLFYEHSEA
jgi:hypothetical protein